MQIHVTVYSIYQYSLDIIESHSLMYTSNQASLNISIANFSHAYVLSIGIGEV